MRIIENQICVVTGGTKGVGEAVANQLRQWNNTVVVLARGAEDNGKDSFKCDVSQYQQVSDVFDKIYAIYGKIDLLINNVGMGQSGAIEFLDVELLKEIVDVNLMSCIYCTKAALMRNTTPMKIVNISSAAAFGVCPFRTMYSVTKDAVNVFTEGMRIELYGTDVQVCSISLGDTATDFGIHHPNVFTSSPRYGSRITASDDFSATRSANVEKPPKDRRMKPELAALGICKVAAKPVFKKYTYCIGFKYKSLYRVSRLFNLQSISEILRCLFEKK